MKAMIKATGIVRNLDSLGRIMIPTELRRTLGIGEKDGVEIFTDGERIVLKKYSLGCSFCGGLDDMKTFRDKTVCSRCLEEIKGTR